MGWTIGAAVIGCATGCITICWGMGGIIMGIAGTEGLTAGTSGAPTKLPGGVPAEVAVGQ